MVDILGSPVRYPPSLIDPPLWLVCDIVQLEPNRFRQMGVGRWLACWPSLWMVKGVSGIPRPWIWASYQIRNISGCACTGNAGNVFPLPILQRKPLVSDPGMHVGIAYPRWWGKRSRHSRRMRTCNLSIWQEAHETTLHLTKQIAHSSGDFNIVA